VKRALTHLIASDKRLAGLIDQVGPCHLHKNSNRQTLKRSPFEALAESIVYQQLHGKAAATIWQRVLDIYGGTSLGRPSKVLVTPDRTLRSAGLSQNKLLAFKDLAQKADEGLIPSWKKMESLEDDEIIEALTTVRGIGPWTVQMILIFQMLRPDVFPSTDFGVQKGYQLLYNKRKMPTPKQLLAAAEKWRPYRSSAAWYLWRATDLP
jgi:DNA-3-methyladenine glycosylase II